MEISNSVVLIFLGLFLLGNSMPRRRIKKKNKKEKKEKVL